MYITIYFLFFFLYFFFFSSRRRHTRCLSDWSSDVCSSDLRDELVVNAAPDDPARERRYHEIDQVKKRHQRGQRSEERRVGKECRSRWSPDHEKKKRIEKKKKIQQKSNRMHK